MSNPPNKKLDEALRNEAVRLAEDRIIKGDPGKPRGGLLPEPKEKPVVIKHKYMKG